MKIARLLIGAAAVSLAVSGCTATAPAESRSSPTAAPPSSVAAATGTPSRILTGTFVSQAAPTNGEVTLAEKPGSLVLTLKDFSTGAGEDLYINLNPGAMTRNSAGDDVVENPNQFQVAPLASRTGTQNYDLTRMIDGLPEIHSVTIYSNKSREAFGTANLQEK